MEEFTNSDADVAIKTENQLDDPQFLTESNKNNLGDTEDDANEEKVVDSSISLFAEIFSDTPKIDSIVHFDGACENSKNDNFFRCEICIIWYNDIDELFLHIMEEHQHIGISDDMQDILYKQWEKILKMERTIMELVTKNKFKSAKRHLKSSLITLNGIITNVFSLNDNIFKYFIFSMRPRIKTLIKEAKLLNSNNLKEIDNKLFSKNETDKFLFSDKPEKFKQGKKRKKKYFQVYQNLENSSDFSSDDNLCLKEAVKRIKINPEQAKTLTNVENREDCLKKITYYVIPEKNNGQTLSFFDKEKIRMAVRDALKKKYLDANLCEEISFKRFDLEDDEVIPNDAFVINEWILPNKYSKVWETMTFQDFLSKNISKKYKKKINEYNITEYTEVSNVSESEKSVPQFSDNTAFLTDEKIRCNICPSVFISQNELKIHTVNIHHISDFSCDTCGEIFLYKGKLLQHELLHHSTNADHNSSNFPSPSEVSGSSTTEVNKITGKVVKYDKNSIDAPECDKCFRRFTSFGRLSQHVAIAHEGKIFVRNKNKNKNDNSVDRELDS